VMYTAATAAATAMLATTSPQLDKVHAQSGVSIAWNKLAKDLSVAVVSQREYRAELSICVDQTESNVNSAVAFVVDFSRRRERPSSPSAVSCSLKPTC